MEFYVNHPFIFILVAIIVAVVLGQSVYFLVKAMRRSKQLAMDQTKIKKTIRTAAIFTIAPAVAIVISVVTLSKKLGIALPWLRLSVVGSMSYETIAATKDCKVEYIFRDVMTIHGNGAKVKRAVEIVREEAGTY